MGSSVGVDVDVGRETLRIQGTELGIVLVAWAYSDPVQGSSRHVTRHTLLRSEAHSHMDTRLGISRLCTRHGEDREPMVKISSSATLKGGE